MPGYHGKICVQLDVLKVHDHIQLLLVIFQTHRRDAEVRFNEDIMVQADKIAKADGIELRMPRQCGWPNYQSKMAEEYIVMSQSSSHTWTP